MEIQHDEIGPPPGLQDAALALGHQPGHILRHAPDRLGQGAIRHGHHVPHALLQGAARTDQGLSLRVSALLFADQGHPAAHLPLAAADLAIAGVDAVGQARQLDAVGDEDAAGRVGAQRHAQHARVQVHAVGDDGVVGPVRLGQAHQAGQAGLAVVEGRHGVEDVGQGSGAGVQGREARVVGGGGVAERDGDAGVLALQVADQPEGAGQFGREGHQFEGRRRGGEVVDALWAAAAAAGAGVEVEEVGGVVRAFLRGVQIRSFRVGAEEGGTVREGPRREEGEDLVFLPG